MRSSSFKLIIMFIVLYLALSEFAFGFEFPQYELDCALDLQAHTLSAKQKVVFTNNSDKSTDAVYFHLYPNRKYTKKEQEFMYRLAGYFKIDPFPEGFQSGSLKINSITYENAQLSYAIEGKDETILKVVLPRALSPKQTITIYIDFKLTIPHAYGRFGWHKDITALCRWYPILSVLDNEGWHNYPFYPYHQPFFSDSAFYKVSLRLPKIAQVIHTGFLKDSIETRDGGKLISIETEQPVRDFALAVSPNYKKYSTTYDNIKINSFYLAGDEFYGQKAAEFAKDLMNNYTNKFGSYPYKEFNIAPVYLGYGGGQASNMIFIDTRVYKLPKFLVRYFDFLISHETGHQWFYNIVGSDEFKEMWIDEGINSFFILSYLEGKYGPDAQVMVLPKFVRWLVPNFSFRRATTDRYLFLAKNGLDRPILRKLSSFSEPTSIFSLTYGKGAVVVDMLKRLVGDEAFGKIMQRYFRDFRFGNIEVDDFIKIAEQESGENLQWFFQEWLMTNKKCDYAITRITKNEITVDNLGEIQMPITATVEFSDGTTRTESWDGKEKTRIIKIDSGEQIKSVRLNSEDLPLDIDQVNNIWPRSLHVKGVPYYFFPYEMPLFLDKEAYNIVGGPQASEGVGLKASLQRPFDNIFYTSVGYDISGEKVKSSLGYELRHVFNKQMSLGFELFNDEDTNGEEEDLTGGKIYLRRELWPVSYGITQINDHITFYIIRNQRFDESSSSAPRENVENISYRRNDEAIAGAALQFDRSGPYPDPLTGFKFASSLESAGHFLGGKEAFNRMALELSNYFSPIPRQKIASHLKLGISAPSDKNLFELGSAEGLRGYDRKTVRGANMILGNFEYRFPLKDDINYRMLDNVINFSSLQAVVFFDVGKGWFSGFEDSDFKKDAGLGLRFHISLGEFLEKIVVRLDVAQAINEPKEDPHVWLGINHAF